MKHESEMPNRLGKFKNKILDVIFPRHNRCVFCDEELNERERNDTCLECLNNLPYVRNACPRCGGEIVEDDKGVCQDCKRNNYEFDHARAIFNYEGLVQDAVYRFKYSGLKFYAEPLGSYLNEKFAMWGINPDIITFVPMHKNKFKERGYNQAQMLAETVGKKFNIPCLDLVLKEIEKPSQTTLSFNERRDNVKDTFKFNKNYKNEIKDKSILLIDDVFTTGATSSEIAGLMKRHGATSVYVLTLAHTKLKKD